MSERAWSGPVFVLVGRREMVSIAAITRVTFNDYGAVIAVWLGAACVDVGEYYEPALRKALGLPPGGGKP